MRGALILLLLAVAAAADPFAPSREDLGVDEAAYARYVETLAILQESLDRDPAGSLDRALQILEQFGIGDRLEDAIAKALAGAKEAGPARGTLLALSAHLLVQKADGMANVWVFGPNGVVRREGVDDEKLLDKAIDTLREAIELCPKDPRAKEDLATALDLVDAAKNADEVAQLRTEAAVLRMGRAAAPEQQPPAADDAARLRREAEALEQRETDPDHAKALLLRKEALVRDFSAHTIPFEYDPTLYGPVSLLATEDLVVQNLTRTYRKRDGTVDSVPPTYHPAKPAQRIQLIEGLGRQPGAAAGAALLKLLATANARDATTDAAMKALVAVDREDVRRHLPALLAGSIYREDILGALSQQLNELRRQLRALGVNDAPVAGLDGWGYSPLGQALLVEAAVALKVREAAPILGKLLPLEYDLSFPRGIALAIGELGGPEQADALLTIVRDPSRDVYFRREAILALGRVAPARLSEVPAEPRLEIALAAARYRSEPSEALKGRLLQGLGTPHEVDEAARYMTDLGIREAVPEIERFLEEHPDHYAVPLLRALKTSS
ncbi:MAG TPA: hypothetical protein VFY93_15955 [Planctomycetota bacterium]|nr:hypothetical protein [Planctomycetota bacterium]